MPTSLGDSSSSLLIISESSQVGMEIIVEIQLKSHLESNRKKEIKCKGMVPRISCSILEVYSRIGYGSTSFQKVIWNTPVFKTFKF